MMQLFVIAVTIPWLILLSRIQFYKWIRITGAGLAACSGHLAWIIERISQRANSITGLVTRVVGYAPWLILILACITLLSYCGSGGKRIRTFLRIYNINNFLI